MSLYTLNSRNHKRSVLFSAIGIIVLYRHLLFFYLDIASVRYRRIHCTACDVHIGSAPSQAHNMLEHPVLRTLLCEKCHEFYGDGSFEQGK